MILKKLILCFSFLTLLLCGCDKSSSDDSVMTSLQKVINDSVYEYTLNGLKNENARFPYLPESLKTLLLRPVVVENKFYTVFELCFPQGKGEIKILPQNKEHKETEEVIENITEEVKEEEPFIDMSIFSEEEERMNEEIEQMKTFVQTEAYSSNDERRKAFEAEIKVADAKSLEVIDSNYTLSYMEFEDEVFIPQKNGDGWIFINAAKDKVTRTYYDSLFRCYREEKWIIDSSREELIKEQDTTFYGNSFKIASKSVSSKDSKKKQSYNRNGLLIDEKTYKTIDGKNILKSTLTLDYDNENRIIESEEVDYIYKDDACKVLDYSLNKKYIYKYKGPKKKNSDEKQIPPDFDYYEDGVLKMKNNYTTIDSYTSQIFFEDGVYVTSYYEKGKLVKEVFVTNSDNERIKNHE